MVFPQGAKWYERVRIARLYHRQSQNDVAAAIGVSRRTYGRFEKGETPPNEYARRKLAEVLEEPIETLFKGL